MGKDKRIGKIGSIKSAIGFRRDDSFTVSVGGVDDFESDLHVKDFAVAPRLNRVQAAEFPSDVVHYGIIREEGDERRSVVVIGRPNVGFDNSGQLWLDGNTSFPLVEYSTRFGLRRWGPFRHQ